jgi:ClpP class serine protease
VSTNAHQLTGAFRRVLDRQGGGSMDLSALLPEQMVIEAREGLRLRKSVSSVSETAFAAAAQAFAAGADGGRGYRVTAGGVAVLDIRGVLSKEFSLWGLLFGGQACTEHVLAMLNAAVDDPAIKRILAVFDTPGGDVRGIDELAEAFFLARKAKPVIGFGADRCTSAGFWLAAQCEKLYLSANCSAGAIGIRIVCEDDERADLNAGIDRKAFGSVPAKTAMPDAAMQQIVDDLAANFIAAVARGRGIPLAQAQGLADALPYIGQRAVARGLADGVTTLQALVGQLEEEIAAAPLVTVDVEITPSPEDDETETGRASSAPATQTRAEGEGHLEAQQEDPMAEPTASASVTPAQLGELTKALASTNERLEALSKENTALKVQVSGVSENVVSMTTEKQTLALLEKARANVQLTKGNETILEPAIRAMAAMDIAKASAFVESLPKLGKGEGKVLTPGFGAAAGPPVRHRFDVMGAKASASDSPDVREFKEFIGWTAAVEATPGTPKFKNVVEARAAFHAARVNQERTA